MKTLFIIFLICFIDFGTAVEDDEQLDQQFDHSIWLSWKNTHQKDYNDIYEEEEHLKFFKRRSNLVSAQNDLHKAGKSPFSLALYAYADLNRNDFLSKRTGFKMANSFDIDYEKNLRFKLALNSLVKKTLNENATLPIKEGTREGRQELPESSEEKVPEESIPEDVELIETSPRPTRRTRRTRRTTVGPAQDERSTTKRQRRTRTTKSSPSNDDNEAEEVTRRTRKTRTTKSSAINENIEVEDITRRTRRTRATRTTPIRVTRPTVTRKTFPPWTMPSRATTTRKTTTKRTTTKRPIPNPFVKNGLNWVSLGKVTPVKDQGLCGSCWTFAIAAAMESNLLITNRDNLDLSEQNLLDCDTEEGGCNGGDPFYAMNWLKDEAITTESNYPYAGTQGICKKSISGQKYKVLNQTVNYQLHGDEDALKSLIDNFGPAVVAIHASDFFQSYKSGILVDNTCNYELNHAVTVVGYGTENNLDYWLVKNSWGTGWGEGGYIRMARNRNSMCGIATFGSVPYVA